MMDLYLDLADTGVDWLAEAVEASTHRGITPWISVRMNDPHGYLEEWIDNPINCPLFKDPANRLKGRLFARDVTRTFCGWGSTTNARRSETISTL